MLGRKDEQLPVSTKVEFLPHKEKQGRLGLLAAGRADKSSCLQLVKRVTPGRRCGREGSEAACDLWTVGGRTDRRRER